MSVENSNHHPITEILQALEDFEKRPVLVNGRLRALRTAMGYSQMALAERTGSLVTQTSISLAEQGRGIRRARVRAIATALGTNLEELI